MNKQKVITVTVTPFDRIDNEPVTDELLVYWVRNHLRRGELGHIESVQVKTMAFKVGAYVPLGEHPVLVPMLGDAVVGSVARRGDLLYARMLEACNGSPEWLYGQKPMPLVPVEARDEENNSIKRSKLIMKSVIIVVLSLILATHGGETNIPVESTIAKLTTQTVTNVATVKRSQITYGCLVAGCKDDHTTTWWERTTVVQKISYVEIKGERFELTRGDVSRTQTNYIPRVTADGMTFEVSTNGSLGVNLYGN